MKTIWMLAAAASLAACAGRGEDDMGAAPDRGDTTAVTTGADTTQWDTTNTGGVGQTAEPGMLPDTTTGNIEEYPTTPSDTGTMQDPGMTPPSDTTMGDFPSDTSSMGADTSSMGGVGQTADPGMLPDTTTGMSQDSAWTDPSAGSTDTTQTAQ
ncbi:MAG: hypothetical protein H0T68_11015 [Gemmatimonadales bacterium]|nr:hypothetical protein [Gemmatimonadales bacterium]